MIPAQVECIQPLGGHVHEGQSSIYINRDTVKPKKHIYMIVNDKNKTKLGTAKTPK